MKILKRIFLGLVLFFFALMLTGLFLPSHYRVERSIVIQAPAALVYPQIADMRNWKNWGVWYQRDPEIKLDYSTEPGPDAVGGWHAWKSDTQGNGQATLVELKPGESVGYKLSFEGFEMESRGVLALVPVDGGVGVTWSDEGDIGPNPLHRWMGMLLDNFVGGAFEAGLKNLKTVSEKKSHD